jgi:lipopolysaccharide export system permease protein
MKTIDRYLLLATLRPLAVSLAIALLALLLERLVMLFDLVAGKGGSYMLVLSMLTKLLPHFLGMAAPAAFFAGIVLSTMRLSTDSEIDAFQAVGVGPYRLLAPIMIPAVLLMAALALILGFVRPYTSYEYKMLVHAVTHSAWANAVERGVFFSGFGDFTTVVDNVESDRHHLSGVFVHEDKPTGGTTTTAQEGTVYRSNLDYRLILSLRKGTQVSADERDDHPTVVNFERLDMPLDMQSEQFRDRGSGGTGEFTILELWRWWHKPLPALVQARVESEMHGRLVRVVSILVLPLLGAAIGLASRPGRRPIGLFVGLPLLILYHYVLQFGQGLANNGSVAPWLAYWLPFAMFAGLGVWAFHEVTARPGHNPLMATLDRLTDMTELRRLRRRASAEQIPVGATLDLH